MIFGIFWASKLFYGFVNGNDSSFFNFNLNVYAILHDNERVDVCLFVLLPAQLSADWSDCFNRVKCMKNWTGERLTGCWALKGIHWSSSTRKMGTALIELRQSNPITDNLIPICPHMQAFPKNSSHNRVRVERDEKNSI